MKLYIIGNGFDLNHRLETSYNSFRDYLISRGIRVFDFENNEYCPNPIGEDWSNIEQHLELNYLDLMCDTVNTYYPDLLNDESDSRWHNITIEVEIKTEFINKITHEYFNDWINSIDTTCSKKISLDTSGCFITFNYTRVLEDTYNINPFHVHGMVGGNMQFGCFENDPSEIFKQLVEEYSNDQWYGVSIEEAVHEIKRYCEYTFKDYELNKQKLISFLSNKHVDEVIVMGHNFLGIDECYYREIFSKYKCKWTIYCHGCQDKENAVLFGKKYNLSVNIIEW